MNNTIKQEVRECDCPRYEGEETPWHRKWCSKFMPLEKPWTPEEQPRRAKTGRFEKKIIHTKDGDLLVCFGCRVAQPTRYYTSRVSPKTGEVSYWGRCKKCKSQYEAQRKRRYPERTAAQLKAAKIAANLKYRKLRREVIANYGGKCTCCGEATYEFLSLDHVNNDGNEQRKKINHKTFLKWIIDNDYPDSIQVHCYNCNWAKYKFDGCPHRTLALKNKNIDV